MIANIVAILIATIASYIVGMLWYSPTLFQNTWKRGAKMKEDEMKPSFGVMVVWIISTFVMVYALNVFIQVANATTLTQSVLVAVYTWVGFVATGLLGSIIWEKKPISFYFVNAFYFLLSMILSAAILVTI